MIGFLKAHLVFSDIDKEILEEISNYCQVTAIHQTLDEANLWSKSISGDNPDLILINCGTYIISSEKSNNKEIIKKISEIKSNRPSIRIVLLMPERLFYDTQLITKLLRLELYNFWFMDSFDKSDIMDFVFSTRTLSEVEEYLKGKETANINKEAVGSFGMRRKQNIVYQPYYVKSNVIAFYSEDDSLLNYGLAALTALELAEQGLKVALIETVSGIPQLASVFSVPHPYYNTRHAVTMYAQQNNDFIRSCFFNNEIYLNDKNSPLKETYIEDFPRNLFLLPDGVKKDNLCRKNIEIYWSDFINELTRIIIFEENFNFLIFICQGCNYFNDYIIREIAYQKFVTINMLPGSIVNSIDRIKNEKGKTHLIGEKNIPYISNQLVNLAETSFLYFPDEFSDDFLEYVYLKKKNRIRQETKCFIKQIMHLLGIKTEFKIDRSQWVLSRLFSFMQRKTERRKYDR